MILLLTNSRDLTTDLVVRELRARGVAYGRLNCDGLAEARLTFGLGHRRPSSAFRDGDRTVDLDDVAAAYLRRPQLGRGPGGVALYPYAVREWSALLDGLYSELEGRWLNEPRRIQAAEDKLRQLRLAASVGFDVPATVVTNDPEAMNDLIAAGPCVAKPLREGSTTPREPTRSSSQPRSRRSPRPTSARRPSSSSARSRRLMTSGST